MSNSIHKRLQCAVYLVFAVSLSFPISVFALEGGLISTNSKWNSSTTHEAPSAEVRQKEKVARDAAIAADIQRLRARLQRTPSEQLISKLHERFKEITKHRGWAPEVEMVFGTRDVKSILNGQKTLHPNLLASYVQFRDDMAKRDIDVIFMPFAPTPHVYGHELIDGINADHEYTPGWTKMMLQMLEADLEVIDPISEWRAASKSPMVTKWPNDFHTASGGRMIAADLLRERLKRYDFARDMMEKTPENSYEVVSQRTTKKRIGVVNSSGAYGQGTVEMNFPKLLANRKFDIVRYKKGNLPQRSEIVLIGDSENHSAVYGSGWPEIVSNKLGATLRWGSRSGTISGSMNPIYLDVVPDYAVQPRVVVVTHLVKYFWLDDIAPPKALPGLGEMNNEGIPIQPFNVTVEILKISQPPVEDPKQLDYDRALFHSAARVVEGPESLVGKEIGIRYAALHKDEWTHQKKKQEVGKTLRLRLHHWPDMLKKKGNSSRGQIQIFDDTDQDLLIPIFWVHAGELSGFRRPAKM